MSAINATLQNLAEHIQAEHDFAQACANQAVQHAIACGLALQEAREQVPHGGWLPWLKENVRFSERMARNYLNLAANRQRVADLNSVREALAYLSSEGDEASPKQVLPTLKSGDEAWYTPAEYVEAARSVLGNIDLDPASNVIAQGLIQARQFYTADDDGLAHEWAGRVWMNPPYTARVINRFIDKLCDSYERGAVPEAIALTNNTTDTEWFHRAIQTASAVCFTRGRISFYKGDQEVAGNPIHGQAFLYFGKNIAAFRREFSAHGVVLEKSNYT